MANFCIIAVPASTVADGTPATMADAVRVATGLNTVTPIVAPATLQSVIAANPGTPIYSDLDPVTGLMTDATIETIEEAKAATQTFLNGTGLAARAAEVNIVVTLGTRVF